MIDILPRIPSPLTPKVVQELLCVHGIGVVITGKADAATNRAVRELQETFGLPANGELDAATEAALGKPIRDIAKLAHTAGPMPADFGKILCWVAEQHLTAHVHEVGGDNRGPWVRLVSDGQDGPAAYWCAWWATFVVQQAWDIAEACGWLPTFTRPRYRAAYCPTLQATAKKDGRLITRLEAQACPTLVKAGHLFLVYSAEKGRVAHVGIVIDDAQADGTFVTIEGNTSDDGSRNGFEVARRIRTVDACDFVDLLK